MIRELDGAGSKRLLAAPAPADALAPYDLAVFVFDSGALPAAQSRFLKLMSFCAFAMRVWLKLWHACLVQAVAWFESRDKS